MAGLSNTGGGHKTFVTIFEGKFCKKVEAGTPDAVHRVNKNEKEVWELHYKALEDVYIRDIAKKDHEQYGMSWIISLETDDGQEFDLQLPYSGRTTNGLMHRLPNIDLNKPVTLIPSRFKEIVDGKDTFKTFLTVHQFGEKVAQYWTKENPGDLPQMKQVMFKGSLKWDDTEQMQYIEAMIEQNFKPFFAAMKENAPAKPAPAPAAQPPVNTAPPVNPTAPVQADLNTLTNGEMDEYLVACQDGFPGTIEQYRIYKAKQAEKNQPSVTSATAPAAKTPTPPPAPKIATPPPAKTAMPPAPKVSAPQSEANFAGMAGATTPVNSTETIVFNRLKAAGYKGTLGEVMAFVASGENESISNVILNAAGELEFDGLPF